MTPTILYLGPEEAAPWMEDILSGAARLLCTASEREAVLPLLEGSDILLDASMRLPLTADLLGRCPRLKLVITATTGADHIDAAHLLSRNIPLLTLKTEKETLALVNAAAELSWLLLMACSRKLRAAISHVTEGGWDRTLFPGWMLRGRTLGIIGCGRNGRWMAKYAQAFGMKTLGFDPFLTDYPAGVEAVTLETLLAGSDAVAIHATYSPETHHLLNSERLGLIREGAILINTSRGAIVDEEALVRSLAEGRLSAVGTDVIACEPDITRSPLWQYAREHDNVTITPHIGGFSHDALKVVMCHTAQRIVHFLNT